MDDIPNKVIQNKKKCFVKSGTPPLKRTTTKSGALFLTNDRKVVTDVNKQYVFSIQIALTVLRPDILMYSPSLRHLIIIELIYPCEENLERWHSITSNKYEPSKQKKKWPMGHFAVDSLLEVV